MPRKCSFPECKKQPTFGIEDKQPVSCKEHKLPDMINVTDKRCSFPECKKRPTFGIEDKQAVSCKEHAEPNMIDVVNKRCSYPGCKKHPKFGIEDKQPVSCKEHAEPDMIDVSNKRCSFPECKKRPNFGYEGKRPDRCSEHKLIGMINVANKMCKSNDLTHACGGRCNNGTCKEYQITCGTRANSKFKGFCCKCYIWRYPNDPKSIATQKRMKIKEDQTCDFIITKFPEISWKREYSGYDLKKSRRRIDICTELDSNILLAVEIDENQHKDRDNELERYNEIFEQIGKRIIWIRFNPDFYIDINGSKKNPSMPTRFKSLEKTISEILKNNNMKETELYKIHYLFYNEIEEYEDDTSTTDETSLLNEINSLDETL